MDLSREGIEQVKREALAAAYAAGHATLALRRAGGCVPDFDRVPMTPTARRLSRREPPPSR